MRAQEQRTHPPTRSARQARPALRNAMNDLSIDDARAQRPEERLLEDSWSLRSRGLTRRELVVEGISSILFLAVAVPLALAALHSHHLDLGLAAVLVGLYAVSSRLVRFPIGAGYLVPSYAVLVPMLLLLPAGTVPLLAALGLAAGALVQASAHREELRRVLFSCSDAWHTLGPAGVLLATAPLHGALIRALVYLAAFLAGCLLDLLSASLREGAISKVRTNVQLRVIAMVWLVDACVAPLGLLVTFAAELHRAAVLLLIPFNVVLLLVSRERTARIAQAQRRLDLVAAERSRLQMAVRRMGEALAAKLDLEALTNIVLRGSVEALAADAGRLELRGVPQAQLVELNIGGRVQAALEAAAGTTLASERPAHVERGGVWSLAVPLGFSTPAGQTHGVLVVAREGRPFREDEQEVVRDLVEQTRVAASDIVLHELLREQANTDALTRLGNRRKLESDAAELLPRASGERPLVLIAFDLDGFKDYNDTFGHPAGDAMLERLGAKLAYAVRANGSAYRLGGDEFCVLASVAHDELEELISASVGALEERGETFMIGASCGAVLLPHEARDVGYAMQVADQRLYQRKRARTSPARTQARDLLMQIMQARQPALEDHSSQVGQLCLRVGRRFGMSSEGLDGLVRAAELHDIGKVGIPESVLEKPAPLDEAELAMMRQHTILGERILSAAPSLRPVAVIVRASHERWDGRGYPDGLAGEAIPLGARIIAACDAYEAMTSDRVYRRSLSREEALQELLAEAGRQFDPTVVDVLVQELGALQAEQARASAASEARHRDPRAQAAHEVASYLRRALSPDPA